MALLKFEFVINFFEGKLIKRPMTDKVPMRCKMILVFIHIQEVSNHVINLGCKCQHKRDVDWCGCSPMVFQMGDMEKVQKSKSRQVFFARKFDAKISQTVINEIDQWILSGEDEENILWAL